MKSAASTPSSLLKSIGPGLLFAGAAIGVSHLVQSTKAGALYGLGLLGIVLLANLTKYPGLSFGSRYTNGSGLSLLESYRRQGLWTLIVFAALTLGTMFTVAAAVTLVTAAILNQLVLTPLLGVEQLQTGALILFGIIALCLKTGGFKWLDKGIKVLLGTMAALTFIATAMVLPELDLSTVSFTIPSSAMDVAAIGFVVALAGWMPAPMDISVWNSMWALAKQEQTGRTATARETRFDFNLGFTLCVLLAVCFMILGTVVMHQNEVAPASTGVGMAKQILSLFTETLGPWSLPIVGSAALAVMFSTTLTVLDAFPRVLVVLVERFRAPESPGDAARDFSKESGYWIAWGLLVTGALILMQYFMKNLGQMVDLATTLSFVTTPILALFNHRAIHAEEVSAPFRPTPAMTWFSIGCIVFLSGFAAFYLWSRFFLAT